MTEAQRKGLLIQPLLFLLARCFANVASSLTVVPAIDALTALLFLKYCVNIQYYIPERTSHDQRKLLLRFNQVRTDISP